MAVDANALYNGAIKFFNERAGWGWIWPMPGQGLEGDVWFHVSRFDGHPNELRKGTDVCFSAENGPKGMRATRVVPV